MSSELLAYLIAIAAAIIIWLTTDGKFDKQRILMVFLLFVVLYMGIWIGRNEDSMGWLLNLIKVPTISAV